ncbi:hypothetical protein MRX96_048610 [Rhipicephalus microplus]
MRTSCKRYPSVRIGVRVRQRCPPAMRALPQSMPPERQRMRVRAIDAVGGRREESARDVSSRSTNAQNRKPYKESAKPPLEIKLSIDAEYRGAHRLQFNGTPSVTSRSAIRSAASQGRQMTDRRLPYPSGRSHELPLLRAIVLQVAGTHSFA